MLIRLVFTGMVLYLILAGFSGLGRSIHTMQHARLDLVAAAAGLIVLSYGAATATYRLLAARAIPFGPTLLVQISGGLVNRLLPAGLGGLGINALYLRRKGHTLPVATAIVAANNALGFVGNILLLAVTVAFSSLTLAQIAWPHVPWPLVIGLVVLIAVGTVYAARRYNVADRLVRSAHEIGSYGKRYFRRPDKGVLALVTSCAVTLLHASALFLILAAVHNPVSWPVALVAISAGAFTGAAIPTPGGLGGAEAGIAAALITFSVPLPVAASAAVLFRLLTYWLPLIPGYLAFRIVERRYL